MTTPEGEPDDTSESTAGAAPDPPVIGISRKDEDVSHTEIPSTLPLLPLRRIVLFPGTVVPLTIGRASSRRLLEESLTKSKVIGIVTQKDAGNEEPDQADLYRVGVAVLILKMVRQGEDRLMVVAQALRRFAIRSVVQTTPYLRADIEELPIVRPPRGDKEWEALVANLRTTARKLVELTPEVPQEVAGMLASIEDPALLADFLASNLSLDTAQKQDLLEEMDLVKRVRAVQQHLSAQVEIAQLQQKIQQDVSSQFSEAQRRAYLREQIKAIQRQLGEDGPGPDEQVEVLRRRLIDKKPPTAVMEQAEKELKRLYSIPPTSPEHTVIASYLEILGEMPWSTLTPDNIDLVQARQILDRDHYDLDKVKRRLIEYLAVRKLNPNGRGPILCFLGPPGVGKTSLGQSIADALGRKFSRMSLGGIRDEAEIRGHRRTYIGSMPGRVVQELRRVGTRNPIIMLDEVDKIGADFHGDPASALLEVLDPSQNGTFVDRYLDVPFDLSQVIFIATANYIDPVPPALRDRMEILEIPGYTQSEKLQIAKRYLVPRQLAENGVSAEQCQFGDTALQRIIDEYTHEAGVRDLERQIGAVCRAVAARVAGGEAVKTSITPEMIPPILGPARFIREARLSSNKPGVVTGLAYTPSGGEVLYVEAAKYPGKGVLTLTGQIGAVMKESVQAALSLVRSRAEDLGLRSKVFAETDIHVHVPSGAVPKDGPSAGIAMFTAIASLFAGVPVRADTAMTGEISLRGLVLPIGGLKEKSLAAVRAGITRMVVPQLNEKDLPELPAEVKERVEFVFARDVDQVLEAALERPIKRGGRKGAEAEPHEVSRPEPEMTLAAKPR